VELVGDLYHRVDIGVGEHGIRLWLGQMQTNLAARRPRHVAEA